MDHINHSHDPGTPSAEEIESPSSLAQYTVRRGKFTGRKLRNLTDEELGDMIAEIPPDANAHAGIKMMRHILQKHGGSQLIDYVEWGQNILDTTGKILPVDFTPDAGEPPLSDAENEILKTARPKILNRRSFLLTAPSAIIALYTSTRLGLSVAESLLDQSLPGKGVEPLEKDEQRKTISRINEQLDRFSSPPLELLNMATLLFEVLDMINEYEPQKFEEISNAVAEIADNMGIGDPTPTFRLRPKQVPVHSR